jgi:hypothetical protein
MCQISYLVIVKFDAKDSDRAMLRASLADRLKRGNSYNFFCFDELIAPS